MTATDKATMKKSLAKSEKCMGKLEKLCGMFLSYSPAKRRASIESFKKSIKDVKADTAAIKKRLPKKSVKKTG